MTVGLECKAHWCTKILQREKTVELRQYELPEELIGQEGLSSIPDSAAESCPGVSVVGWVIFNSVKEYKSKAEWETDTPSHCVPADTPYSWNEETQRMYGWCIQQCGALSQAQPTPAMHRLKRSLFVFKDTVPSKLRWTQVPLLG